MFDDEEFRALDAFVPGDTCLSLALQGGGSFGAFTWGVLDRLLEEPSIRFDCVSGASAGAVNAVLLASGWLENGRDGARRTLDQFWRRVGQADMVGSFGGVLEGLLELTAPATAALRRSGQVGLAQMGLTLAGRPSAFNPLRELLETSVDFERLRVARPMRLLIAATRVRDGRLHLFREDEVTVDMVLASACLPTLNKAVEIDGEAYWDGGLSANPPLRHLARESAAREIVLVQIMPEAHSAIPGQPNDIVHRLGEMAFTAPLQREIEALTDLREVCRDTGLLQSDFCQKLDALQFHRIAAEDLVDDLDQQSTMDTGWPLLSRLHDKGREAAANWVETLRPYMSAG